MTRESNSSLSEKAVESLSSPLIAGPARTLLVGALGGDPPPWSRRALRNDSCPGFRVIGDGSALLQRRGGVYFVLLLVRDALWACWCARGVSDRLYLASSSSGPSESLALPSPMSPSSKILVPKPVPRVALLGANLPLPQLRPSSPEVDATVPFVGVAGASLAARVFAL